jgi:uncharacterized protein (TIGR00251 family)
LVTATRSGVRLAVRVIPRSPKSSLAGVRDGRLLVRVTAPPVDSAANDAVIELVARALGVPKRDVALVGGATARNKTLEIVGLSAADVVRKIVV